MSEDILISICICTYKRPLLLGRLLNVILRDLQMPAKVEIIIVDNDRSGSARAVFDENRSNTINMRYFLEPRQNISIARNRAVAESRGEWLALIDDDEIPVPEWLTRLFKRAIEWNADAVFGPVEPIYGSACPAWLVNGHFFEKSRFRTGDVVPSGHTRSSNVLVRRDLISHRTGPFDPAFGLSGGEDALLFEGLLLEGKRLLWCDDAVVYEHLDVERLNPWWLVRRWYRMGQTFGRLVLCGFGRGRPSFGRRALFFAGSVARFLVAAVMVFASLPFGRAKWFGWIRTFSTQVGKISAFTSFVFEEYADSADDTLEGSSRGGGDWSPPTDAL